MKTPTSVSDSHAKVGSSRIFFNKSERGSFFSKKQSLDNNFFASPLIQTKSASSSKNNRFEEEADRMAEQVVGMSDNDVSQRQSRQSLPKITPVAGCPVQREEAAETLSETEPEKERLLSLQPPALALLPWFRNPNLYLQAPTLMPGLELDDPDRHIDWFSMNQPYVIRGVPQLRMEHSDAIRQRWLQTYRIGRTIGFNTERSIWISNQLTPFAVDAALVNDYPTLFEVSSRELGISPIMLNLPAIQFKRMAIRSADGVQRTLENHQIQRQIKQAKGSGQSMSPETQVYMEDRFGADFSNVKIHSGSEAEQLNRSLNAHAFTVGADIFFNRGQYSPGQRDGKRLLAHELTHVQQQDASNTVRRKGKTGSGDEADIEQQIHDKLNKGHYVSALLLLKDHLNWSAYPAEKKWLAAHTEIRYLFLKLQPGDSVASGYSVQQLGVREQTKAFHIIDTWYQTEADKQTLYLHNMPLFEHLLQKVSPYSGRNIVQEIDGLKRRIEQNTYTRDQGNAEFHLINLLAPGIERKIRFYASQPDLFKAVRNKFDPYTGMSKATFERLTDTNEVDRKKALEIYQLLDALPAEQRNTFLETSAFAGALEADQDAEKYYKKKFRKQYKALPHNWDAAIWPWQWGSWDAPFAQRLSIDHAALMSYKLNFEDKTARKFGFDAGLDNGDPKSKKTTTAVNRLITALQHNLNKPDRLALLLAIGVRGGIEGRIATVLQAVSQSGEFKPAVMHVIESYGFIAADNFRYHAEQALSVLHDSSQNWYIAKQTLFGGKSGKVLGEQRGTFDLLKLQDTEANRGSLGGMKFGTAAHKGDAYYLNSWLDKAVKGHKGSETLWPNLLETSGNTRRGKIFASIRNRVKQANIYAASLPIEGMNYFAGGSLIRSGAGVLQGLEIHLSWTRDTSEPDNHIDLMLSIADLQVNKLQLIAPESTLAIGYIGVKGLQLKFSQEQIPAAKGIFWGLFKNADFTLQALMGLLPNVIMLLPYAIMAMTEEFQGAKEHSYKDKLGEVLKNNFSSLKSLLTFTSLVVRDLYDTEKGFLDDFNIEQRDKEGQLKRQAIRLVETPFWSIDAGQNIKHRIQSIDLKIRKIKADAVDSKIHETLVILEDTYKKKRDEYVKRGTKYEDRYEIKQKLLEIYREKRRLTKELDDQFAWAVKAGMVSSELLNIKVLEKEKASLLEDFNYLEQQYFGDKKRTESDAGGIERFEARQRKEAFEARYKSVEIDMALRGIHLQGGEYVHDLLNEVLKSLGFESPEFRGLEDINIGSVRSAFTASSAGVSKKGDRPGVSIRKLNIPFITATTMAYKSSSMTLTAGKPQLEDVFVSVALDFAENPLDKDPLKSYSYRLDSLIIGKATAYGLRVQIGDADPILNFPDTEPVQIWGLAIFNFDPGSGNLDLKIRDIKASGVYAEQDEAEKSSKKVKFGIDTTLDNKTEKGKQNALALHFDSAGQSVDTQLNIASAWLPFVSLQSDKFSINSLEGVRAVELKNLTADVKVYLKKTTVGDKPGRPLSIELKQLHVDEIKAQGLTFVMRDLIEKETKDGEGATLSQKVQEVRLPKDDIVSIKGLNVGGLRINMAESGTTLSTIEEKSSIDVGMTDLGGLTYSEKNARGSVLKTLALHKGKFNSLKMEALGRNGREYTLKAFFKFFGSTRLEGLDVSGSYSDVKKSGTIELKGKKNKPISIDYHESGEENKAYYAIRLPLQRVNLPALKVETGDHLIMIPKQKSRSRVSFLSDVDARLRAFVTFGESGRVSYDIYIDAIDVAEMQVFGLEYHNRKKSIDVVFDPARALRIPNVKAGGFHYSSSKGFGVFGKEGGWLEAALTEEKIEASFASIKSELENGSFLAESEGGRSAIGLEIESLGFMMDAKGNIKLVLGSISGGFPKMTITKNDPDTGAVTTTTLSSIDKKGITAEGIDISLGADKNNVIDAHGLVAGGLKIVSEKQEGAETSTVTINMGAEAIGAKNVQVKLNADKSKEIKLTEIYGGKIDVDLISKGPKDRSKKYIDLPDPKLMEVVSVKVLIDPDNNQKIVIEKPTIKDFRLRIPSQDNAGDYFHVFCNLNVDGNVELGDGNFASMSLSDPRDAFVVLVPDGVPVSISKLRLEYKDTSSSTTEEKAPTPLTADQELLLDLETRRDEAREAFVATPAVIGGRDAWPNPAKQEAFEVYQIALKAYETQQDKIIGAAKKQAESSMAKKYLDAIQGRISADLVVFDTKLPLKVKTYGGANYVQITDATVASLKELIESIIGSTINKPFWSSDEMKAIGKGLKRWYTWGIPYTRGLIDAIANGNALGAFLVFLEKTEISKGVLTDDPSLFGLNFNINTSWALDVSQYDEFGIGLCELKYKHPSKDDYYNIYGIMEYLGYVSPALVTKTGQQDAQRLKKLAKGKTLTARQASEKDIGETVHELILFVRFSIDREIENIKNNIIKNIKSVDFNADISLKPQEVINELLKEHKAGSTTFDKVSKTVSDVNISGQYKNPAANNPQATVKAGGGTKGKANIVIPGVTYFSQDKGTKVSFDSVQIAPLQLTYKDDIYKILNKNTVLNGLKVAVRKKP